MQDVKTMETEEWEIGVQMNYLNLSGYLFFVFELKPL